MRALDRLAGALASLAAALGTLGLIAAVGVICVDVAGRAFGAPLRGAQDLTAMGLVVVVFGGMALCDRTGGHIAVDILAPRLGRWNRAAEVLAAATGAVVFGLIAWTVAESAALSRMLNLSTNILYLPKAWFQYFVVVMAGITAFGMALRAVALALGAPLPVHEGPGE